MLDILSLIPGKKRNTSSGWVSFNGICCGHRGHKPDTRQRAGITFVNGDSAVWRYSCFNCGFKAGVSPGKQYSRNVKQLLEWCDVDRMQIERMSFYNFTNRDIFDIKEEYKPIIVSFDGRELPPESQPLDPQNPEHKIHIDYLSARGLNESSYQFYVTPTARGREANRIIIPYYYNKKIVGYTSRFYDNAHPKYVSEQQKGYVFNTDAQDDRWSTCIVVEGQFDAIAIGGCAVLGSTISDEQARVLKKLRRSIIVVPDRDTAGMKICDRALELGYSVSIPEWSSEVKDVNDAVVRYGKFQTLLSILQAASTSKIILEMKRKEFK
jgi:hypothetical protein